MSKHTKSFFEQDNNGKKHGPWQSKYPRQPLASSASNVALPPRPPIPASNEIKSKIKGLRFSGVPQDRASMITAGTSANKKDLDNGSKGIVSTKTLSDEAKENQPERKVSLPHANTFPSTPSDKLTLDELIGNIDESKYKKPTEESPDEILGWNPNSSNPATTPGRKRKRAQSSSPGWPSAVSQRDETGPGISTTHRTPIVDPAAELWQRYGGGNSNGSKLPDISFALQATPRPLETPVKAAGLRRWASAGNEWPSNRSKRQRTSSTKVWQDARRPANGQSKVAAMIEKIQENLASQQLDKQHGKMHDLSSSDPLPDIGGISGAAQNPRDRPRAVPLPEPRAASSTGVAINHVRAMANTSKEAHTIQKPSQQGGRSARGNVPVPRSDHAQATIESINVPPKITLAAEDLDEFAMDAFEDFDEGEITTNAPKPPDVPMKLAPTTQQPEPLMQLDANDLAAFDDDFNDVIGDDEFGLADVDEEGFLEAEISATQVLNQRSPRNHTRRQVRNAQHKNEPLPQQPRKYRRFRIQRVLQSTSRAAARPEKVLLAEDESTHATVTITLRGSWLDTAIAMHQIVHVTHAPMASDHRIVDLPGQIFIEDTDTSPLLITLPDHMLSATAVADSFDCTRKAVLSDRIKATSEASKWTVYGKILHEIFQQALIANAWDEQSLNQLVVSTVAAHLEGLWQIGVRDDVMATEEIQAKMNELSAWAGVFVRSTPSLDAKINGSRDETLRMAITGLVAIEEHVWSPMFGLKGNVDATVQIAENSKTSKAIIAPFEVKTGRTTHASSHHAQTALYTLLMSDRYDVAVKAGILYYLESSNISSIAPSTHEIRQMIQQRNRLATAINHAKHPETADTELMFTSTPPMHRSRLPSMARNAQKCGRCYAQESCFLFHALCEDGNADTAGMKDDGKKNYSAIWDEALGHLVGPTGRKKDSNMLSREDALKEWFSRWDRLLTFEESETSRPRKELWTMSSKEREEAGRCFGKLKIRLDHLGTSSTSGTIDGIESSGGKINRFLYTLERSAGAHGRPFNDGTQLTPGEAIVVSGESGQWALANGYVVSATGDSITIGVDRKLGDARQRLTAFDEVSNQVFKGIMKVSGAPDVLASEYTSLYRLDKDEFANGLAVIRSNLVRMMSSHPNHTKLRDLIVFDEKPHFTALHDLQPLQPSQLGQMNEDQQSAVSKVLSANDYALVLGMPGTGKTTTIAHLIRALLVQGKSILLTSYTHTAVDNILLKIRDIAPAGSILRLGVPSKINDQVKQFCHLASSPRTNFGEIDEVYLRTQIVATTCLGVSNALFTRRYFDVCIVDEASQITLPVSLGPLLNARKFVLVGDHYQLSPLVQSRAALEGGLDISLFRLLSEKHPEAIAMLGKQYRMCKDIMSISNDLIYDGRLRCGNDAIATRTLHVEDATGLRRLHTPLATCQLDSCWLQHLTNPQRKVVFANTDDIGPNAQESLINSGKKITNRLEAVITAQLVLSFQAQGVPSSDIGVIALYRTQISLIRQLFGAASISSEVEFDSADRFQGRDKECIIISMVRSNDSGTFGDLIKDWRRLNVAFTRARSKLIVIGSRKTLQNNELMARFLQHVDRRGQSTDLPADAETNHGSAFEFVSQATSSLAPTLLPSLESPTDKKQVNPMPHKPASQSRVLQESRSSGNVGRTGSVKSGGIVKKPSKVIDGRNGRTMASQRKLKEQLAFEILEELNAEDWS